MKRRLSLAPLRRLVRNGSCVFGCFVAVGCSRPDRAAAHEGAALPSLALRYHCNDKPYREHWVYDLDGPGIGIERRALSFDVATTARDASGCAVRHTLRKAYYAVDALERPAPSLLGLALRCHWGPDHSLIGDISFEQADPDRKRAAAPLVSAYRLGSLLEFPDPAVATGDTWSIEPRRLKIGPDVLATLRPSYVLSAVEGSDAERVAVIDSDIQVDLVPETAGPSVVVEGGGSASGRIRVRARDGALLDARTVLHFNQELKAPDNEVIGYREFSLTTHVFITPPRVQPNLANEPLKLEAPDPEEQRECETLLSSIADRLGHSPLRSAVFLEAALHASALPVVDSVAPIRQAAPSLWLAEDGQRIELEGQRIELRDVAKTLRARAPHARAVYLFAPVSTPLERLRMLQAALSQAVHLRVVVRSTSDPTPPPHGSRWLQAQQRLALSARTEAQRQAQLRQLLADHLTLCEGASDAFRQSGTSARALSELPDRIVNAFGKCGCTTTSLDGLESSLYALFGSPNLGFVSAEAFEHARLPSSATLADAAAQLGGTPAPAPLKPR